MKKLFIFVIFSLLYFPAVVCWATNEQPTTVRSDVRSSNQCNAVLTLKEAEPLINAGLCRTDASFLGKPVCGQWQAFVNGTSPKLKVNTFALGAAFRVERAMNGQLLWSEQNPNFALYNTGKHEELTSIGLLSIEPENSEEEKESNRYLEALFSGGNSGTSRLEKYVLEMRNEAEKSTLSLSDSGSIGTLGCSTIYVRQNGKRLYALISTKHGNGFDYDPHPVLYFVIFAPR